MRVSAGLLMVFGFALLCGQRASGVILYPEDDASAGSIPRPSGNVVGQWSNNASCVAIRPNYVLTTRHQGGGPAFGTTVTFGGTQYLVADETPVADADLRIVRITTLAGQPANLTDFVPVYSGNDNATGQDFTVGGFGRGRGAALTDPTPTPGTYGYAWGAGGNDTLRFGRNTIDAFGAEGPPGVPFTSDVLRADFDRRGGATAVPFEATIAEFDSGSGWFVENGPGNWQVRGISAYVDHHPANVDQPGAQALFASHLDASIDAPDTLEAIRLGSYAAFINANVPEPTGLTVLGSAAMLACARRRRTSPSCWASRG